MSPKTVFFFNNNHLKTHAAFQKFWFVSDDSKNNNGKSLVVLSVNPDFHQKYQSSVLLYIF